ncbi:MAG TPA: glycosyltransferase [Pseudonocardiaceae bacterium]|jgi:trehalose synthase|nr:glycosyltransferase [Pseudonocardiaceae bacterium]
MVMIQDVAPDFPQLKDFLRLIGPDRAARLRAAADTIRERLAGGTLWHVNSTPAGGGVAEMLHTLLPLYRSLGVRVGWLVLDGDERFFAVTKSLGLALYGTADGNSDSAAGLGWRERADYRQTLDGNAKTISDLVAPNDVVLLHDHQTAGLVGALSEQVAAVYWRCHIGVDEPTAASESAWEFLAPLLDRADALLFSVRRHVPERLREHRVAILPPFISPFAVKNCDLPDDVLATCLARCGLRGPAAAPVRTTVDTPAGPVALDRPVRMVTDGPPEPGEPIVAQISRWDRLKDMDGVLTAFAESGCPGYLALVGPDPAGIPDDVEQAAWFDRCVRAWHALPRTRRRRVGLICLPMAAQAENAVLVNAIQRAAAVVVQKSLAEGFGLTVTEAMWKSRVVLASAVGGIREQITHGEDGLLVDDPTDRAAFGALLAATVHGAADTTAMGTRARNRVLRDFLPDHEVVTTAELLAGGR